jgi:hypothetical protein
MAMSTAGHVGRRGIEGRMVAAHIVYRHNFKMSFSKFSWSRRGNATQALIPAGFSSEKDY